mgnify:CR=1 FL=1
MSRLRITPWENSQRTVDDLYADMERRISAAPCGNCPVELTSAFLKLCLAQSCGKCVPCRIGLDRLAMQLIGAASLRDVLALDPRPRYQNDPQRLYGLTYAGCNVTFRVEGETVIVVGVE